MHIVSVIPLVPGISKDTLTYSSERALSLGSVIACPFKNKSIDCIVIEVRSLREAKSDLRQASFVVKKISKSAKARNLISPYYIEVLLSTSHYYGIAYSDCFNLLLPKSLASADLSFENSLLPLLKPGQIDYQEIPQAESANFYLQEISSGLDIIVVPSKERAVYLAEVLRGKGAIALHSGVSAIKQNKILKGLHPGDAGLYICTPQFIAFFHSADRIYIDNYSSKRYITAVNPFINTAHVLRLYAISISPKVIAVDALLLAESTHKYPFSYGLIDMTDSANGSKYIWQSAYLEKLLEHNLRSNKKTLLYVHRKGLSAYLSCDDCKTIVTCDCSNPFTLFEDAAGGRTLNCGLCKKIIILDKDEPLACKGCGSWKLQGYGITTELVARDLESSGRAAFVLDSEHAKTPSAARKVYSKFLETPASILVATEMCADFLTNDIDSVCIVSIDSQLLLQVYDTDAEALRKIINLCSYSRTPLALQTRMPHHTVLKVNDSQKYLAWKQKYLQDLEEYFLPPFGVRVSVVKKGFFTEDEKKIVERAFVDQKFAYKNFRGYSYVTARIPKAIWNKTELWMPYTVSLLRASCDVFIE